MIGQRRRRSLAWVVLMGTLLATSCIVVRVHAATKVYLIAVGVNSPVPTRGATLSTLRYADDDAAALFELMKWATQGDGDGCRTQALYPGSCGTRGPDHLQA